MNLDRVSITQKSLMISRFGLAGDSYNLESRKPDTTSQRDVRRKPLYY